MTELRESKLNASTAVPCDAVGRGEIPEVRGSLAEMAERPVAARPPTAKRRPTMLSGRM